MSSGLVLAVACVAGPCLGSFAATATARRACGSGWIAGRSRCDACRTVLPPVALVPILSFAAQHGRARCCGAAIRAECSMVEIAFLAVPLCVWAAGMQAAGTLSVVSACVMGWSLVTLSLRDLRDGRLPDAMTLPLACAGLLWVAAIGGDTISHLAAAGLGYGLIRAIDRIYLALRGRQGLGHGDAKLLMAAGAWCGPQALPGIVLVACLATLGGALLLARGSNLGATSAVPFGPGLALGTWTTFLAGPLLWESAWW